MVKYFGRVGREWVYRLSSGEDGSGGQANSEAGGVDGCLVSESEFGQSQNMSLGKRESKGECSISSKSRVLQ
jgi:hypothetical protein